MARKNNNKKVILISIIAILSVLALIYFFGTRQAVSFSNQCSIPSCPSGYSSVETYCSESVNKCYRECEKQTSGSCGSYGSYSKVKSYTDISWDGSGDSGDKYNTGNYYVSSNKCYKFYSSSKFRYNSRGSADSYRIYSSNSWYSSNICRGYSSTTPINTQTKILGRGTTGRSYSASGWMYDYGSSSCGGGSPINDLEGTFEVALYASTANWNEGSILTTRESCSYQCDSKSECGSDSFTGSRYCSGGDVYQNYNTKTCNNYICGSSDSARVVEQCSYGCSGGACIVPECTGSQTKCEGTTYFNCLNNNWANQGLVASQCGIECTSIDSSACSTNEECVNNICALKAIPEPPKPEPTETTFSSIINNLLSWIKDLFVNLGLVKQQIIGQAVVEPGTTQTYSISISANTPDADSSDGTYQVQYGNWALVDSNGNIIQQGSWEEVSGLYEKQVTIQVPQNLDNYVLVAVIDQFNMEYSFITNSWATTSEEVVVNEGYSIETKLPIPTTPTPSVGRFASILQDIWNWIKSLFGF